ncbi:MAG: efflux RND transporter periplasmic adaptor subunit [Terriglobia bacterium]
MLNRRQLCSFILGVMVIPILLLAGCNRQTSADAGAPGPGEVKVEEIHGDGVVQVEHPEQFLLATVEQRPTWDELQVTGVVTPDVNRAVPVLSLAGGRAVDIRAKLGDEVTKGQVLLIINSAEVSQAFADCQKFQADEVFARQQLTRAQDLYAKGAIARQDLEAAENAEQKMQVDLRTAKQHIAVLGADLSNPSPLVSIRAPISGAIVEQNVTSGAGVRSLDNSPNLFTIADLSRVWVLCDVYENDLHRVHLGDSATVRLIAFPDRVFAGRVGNISTVLDPSTRTAKVRLELANSGGLMRAGMFANAAFRSRTEQLRPMLPTTAILRLHDKDWVFVPLGGNRFRRLEVQAGAVSSGGFQVVLSGLAAGEKVVANALQFASAAGME